MVTQQSDCLIIGAGLTGLLAASRLQQAGLSVTVIDKGRGVGGRMASRRFPAAGEGHPPVFDHGAQFFTVRDGRFANLVDGWLTRGLVEEWSRGFATADGSFYADGHPRFRGVPSMTAVPKHLARNLDVRLRERISQVQNLDQAWLVTAESGRQYKAPVLVLTSPVPQSLAMLDAGGMLLPPPVRQDLEKITYEPCIAVLILLDGPSRLPEPGGLWPLGEPIAWLADNYRKGVSGVPGTVTIHAGPEFSQNFWGGEDGLVIERLLEAAGPWLGSAIIAVQVHRWRYSRPLWIYAKACLAISEPAPLIFAGDAFAGPRVEGAALSGLAAADWLLARPCS